MYVIDRVMALLLVLGRIGREIVDFNCSALDP
jgi:hypothetical protein